MLGSFRNFLYAHYVDTYKIAKIKKNHNRLCSLQKERFFSWWPVGLCVGEVYRGGVCVCVCEICHLTGKKKWQNMRLLCFKSGLLCDYLFLLIHCCCKNLTSIRVMKFLA